MCSRKVVVKSLIFRLFRTLPVSQKLRFLCLIIMACETSGIKLQGPSLCIRTHGWKFLSKKVDRLLTKNPLSETNVEFGFFVSSFLGQLFCFRISPCWSQHRIGPCKFIPIGDSRHDKLNSNSLPVLIIHKHPKCHRTYDHIPQHAIPIRHLPEQKESEDRRKNNLRIIINGYLFRRCMIISRRNSELSACSRKSRT